MFVEQPTPQQIRLLKYIRQYQQKHRRSPTYREMMGGTGARSVAVPNYHIRRLEETGFLRRAEHVARGLTLTDKALALLGEQEDVPVLPTPEIVQFHIRGHIHAGEPVDPGDPGDEDDTVAVDGRMLPKGGEDLFALRVRGDSMVDALVQEGDIILLQQAGDIKDGDMVAAWLQLEEETTLKHFYRQGRMARLQPANPTYDPIVVPASNVQIQGKVVMVLRQSVSA